MQPVQTHQRPPGPERAFAVQDIQADALRFVSELTREYGDIVQYHAGTWPVTLVNRPDYIKLILQDRHRNYVKVGTPDFMMLKPMLGKGILTSDGESWLHQRRLAQPAFHRERVEDFDRLIVDATQTLLTEWVPFAEAGREFDLVDEMTRLTLRIVALALFDYDVSQDAGRFGQAVSVLNECIGHFDPNDHEAYRRFPAALGTIRGVVQDIVRERSCPHAKGAGASAGASDDHDFLAILLAARQSSQMPLSDRHISDQILTLIMAGHETTAKALSWTFYLLGQHPEVEAQMQAEIDDVLGGRAPTAEDLARLPFTWQIIEESMRLYPPVWVVSRTAVEDDDIDGYHIPARSLVSISPFTMHRNPEYWPDPERFDPQRFRPACVVSRPAFAYLPFAGGPRLCLGKHFASVEAHLALVTIAQSYSLRIVPGQVIEPEALVTLRPKYGLRVMLEPRRNAGRGSA